MSHGRNKGIDGGSENTAVKMMKKK